MQGLLGKKLDMTQVVDGQGRLVPVTRIEAGPCIVVRRRQRDHEGYDAVQLGYLPCKEKRCGKAVSGQYKKVERPVMKVMREFRLDTDDPCKAGDEVTLSILDGVTHVDITAVSKGRGFQGVVRRYRMSGGPLTHGGHSKRRVGSIGQNSLPARVMKGKRMPGHMGNVRVTVQNLEVVGLQSDKNVILVKGAVPGPRGGLLAIRKALKKNAGKVG